MISLPWDDDLGRDPRTSWLALSHDEEHMMKKRVAEYWVVLVNWRPMAAGPVSLPTAPTTEKMHARFNSAFSTLYVLEFASQLLQQGMWGVGSKNEGMQCGWY